MVVAGIDGGIQGGFAGLVYIWYHGTWGRNRSKVVCDCKALGKIQRESVG